MFGLHEITIQKHPAENQPWAVTWLPWAGAVLRGEPGLRAQATFQTGSFEASGDKARLGREVPREAGERSRARGKGGAALPTSYLPSLGTSQASAPTILCS